MAILCPNSCSSSQHKETAQGLHKPSLQSFQDIDRHYQRRNMNGMSEQTGTFLEQPRKPSLAGENLKKSSSHRGTMFSFFSPSHDLVWEMNDFSLFLFRLWGEKHGYSLLEVNFGVTYQRQKEKNMSLLFQSQGVHQSLATSRGGTAGNFWVFWIWDKEARLTMKLEEKIWARNYWEVYPWEKELAWAQVSICFN